MGGFGVIVAQVVASSLRILLQTLSSKLLAQESLTLSRAAVHKETKRKLRKVKEGMLTCGAASQVVVLVSKENLRDGSTEGGDLVGGKLAVASNVLIIQFTMATFSGGGNPLGLRVHRFRRPFRLESRFLPLFGGAAAWIII
jgi:hypothetical protein